MFLFIYHIKNKVAHSTKPFYFTSHKKIDVVKSIIS